MTTTRITKARSNKLREPDPQKIRDERAAEAKKIFDENEKDAEDGFTPVTNLKLTASLFDRARMERVGPTAWMEEEERRIRERQGDPPAEPRQVHGVAPAQRPR